jgi:cell wall-associated NlpC family hydrolase
LSYSAVTPRFSARYHTAEAAHSVDALRGDWRWSGGLARAVHGLSIVFATLAVLVGWSPPQHASHGPTGTPDGLLHQEDVLDTPDSRSELTSDADADLADVNALVEHSTLQLPDVAGITAEPNELDLDLNLELDLDLDVDAVSIVPGQEIVDSAMRYLGTRYVWGGTTPAGFDCSGFVYFVLNSTGHPAPRDHGGQLRIGDRVPASELEPGDLLFFQNTYMPGISHGGIYIGDGRFIHANTPGSGVVISSVGDSYWVNHWAAATRVA